LWRARLRERKEFGEDRREPIGHPRGKGGWRRGGPRVFPSHSNAGGSPGLDASLCRGRGSYPRQAHAGSTCDPPGLCCPRKRVETAEGSPARRSAFSSGAPSTPRSS